MSKVATIGGIALVVAAVIGTYVSHANQGNRVEQALEAKYQNNENIYANGTQKVMEIAQVPSMYTADLTKVVKAAIEGRYGSNGSQATVQWLKEAGVSIDSGMYIKIQQVIEAFRNEFQGAQTELLDQCRTYKTSLGNVWGGFWLRTAGYPKLDLSKTCTIVTTDKAHQTFETKRDSGIQLRPAN